MRELVGAAVEFAVRHSLALENHGLPFGGLVSPLFDHVMQAAIPLRIHDSGLVATLQQFPAFLFGEHRQRGDALVGVPGYRIEQSAIVAAQSPDSVWLE